MITIKENPPDLFFSFTHFLNRRVMLIMTTILVLLRTAIRKHNIQKSPKIKEQKKQKIKKTQNKTKQKQTKQKQILLLQSNCLEWSIIIL